MRAVIYAIFVVVVTSIGPFASAQEIGAKALPALHTLWDYSDPAGTRERFQAIKRTAQLSGDDEYYLSLLTQIARTYGMEGQFTSAHSILDIVQPRLNASTPVARVNYLLERGRAFRSAGEIKKSLPLFENAFELADSIGQSYLAIDAAHMMALVVESRDDRMEWNRLGLRLADSSDDPRAINWAGSINNNLGWDYHEQGEYDSALAAFERAVAVREQQGDPNRLRIARWCVARCLRSLSRIDEALAIQTALLKEYTQEGTRDGYVFEELAELYLLKNDSATAATHFADAYRELSQDTSLMSGEAERMARMKRLAGLE
ncbi:MAG: tetratricopeptide repeat protein [Candidatus Zixiibacteriota bacterium]